MSATLRVRNPPFYLTNRGVAVICEVVDGEVRFGLPATVTITDDEGGVHVEHVGAVEAALENSEGSMREWPGLVFVCEREDDRAAQFGQLRVGALLMVTGPATE